MTVKLLADRRIDGKDFIVGNLCATDAATEAGLIAAKLAIADLTGGTAYVPPAVQRQYVPVMAESNPLTGGLESSVYGKDFFAEATQRRTEKARSIGLPLWEASSDNATYSGAANAPTAHSIDGYGCLSVTSANGAYTDITFPAPSRFCNTGNFAFRVFIPPSEIVNVSGITVYAGTTGSVKYVSKAFSPSELGHGGWQTIYIDKSRWSVGAGSMDYAADKIDYLKVRINPNASVTLTVGFKAIYGGVRDKGRLLITSDDNYATWIQRAVPLLDYYGFKSGIGVVANTVGTGGVYASLRQLQQAVEDGHECFTHGTAATLGAGNLSQWSTEDLVLADIASNRDYVKNNGLSFRDSHLFYAYPQNVWRHAYGDNRIINAVKRAGMLAARAGGRGGSQLKWSSNLAGAFDKYVLPLIGHMAGGFALGGSGVEAANITTIQSEIQNLGATGSYSTLMFHRVSDTGAENFTDGLDIGIGNLDLICQTIKTEVDAGRLEVILPSDMVALCRNREFDYGVPVA